MEHVFFDGGQFAQISLPLRRIMTPFLYLAIKSLYWSKQVSEQVTPLIYVFAVLLVLKYITL